MSVRAADCELRCRKRHEVQRPASPFGLVTHKTLLRSRGPQLALSGRSAVAFPFTQKESRIYAFITAALSQSGTLARLSQRDGLQRSSRTAFYKAGNYALTT